MALTPKDIQAGIDLYWEEINSRSPEIRKREEVFPQLADRFSSLTPPEFNRSDLEEIIRWKYTDARWRDRALDGLSQVSDSEIQKVTRWITGLNDPEKAIQRLNDFIKGVGIAGISAILAAARPDMYPVIDIFALAALEHHSKERWLRSLKRDEKGRPKADITAYPPYTLKCRQLAKSFSQETGVHWTARMIDMGLWGLGKSLDARGS